MDENDFAEPTTNTICKSSITENIRKNTRSERKTIRVYNRNKLTDTNRISTSTLNDLSDLDTIVETDIRGLARRIKRLRQADAHDLNRLSHGFLQSNKNIEEFCNTAGALGIIVKELTGQDSNRKLLACECLCNLAIGPDFCTEKVLKSAGSYLVLYLDSFNEVLTLTSLWVLSNIAASNNRDIINSLLTLNICPKLIELIQNKVSNRDIFIESCKILLLVLQNSSDQLMTEEASNIHKAVISLKSNELMFLRLLEEVQVPEDLKLLHITNVTSTILLVHSAIVNNALSSLYSEEDTEVCILILFRILGNIMANEASLIIDFHRSCLQNKIKLFDLLNTFMIRCNEEEVKKILHWVTLNVLHASLTNEVLKNSLEIADEKSMLYSFVKLNLH